MGVLEGDLTAIPGDGGDAAVDAEAGVDGPIHGIDGEGGDTLAFGDFLAGFALAGEFEEPPFGIRQGLSGSGFLELLDVFAQDPGGDAVRKDWKALNCPADILADLIGGAVGVDAAIGPGGDGG